MELLHRRCCGLDVHKETVVACLRLVSDGKVTTEVRTFQTTTVDLLRLSEWLAANDCTHVAMEATGVYWKPVWHILDDGEFELVLANAAHVKNVPGRKTDVNDAMWLAELLAHGLIRASFVPDTQTQEMRNLLRTRKQLVREQSSHVLRVQKTLEDANIKLDWALRSDGQERPCNDRGPDCRRTMLYTPGVAFSVQEIIARPEALHELSIKDNTIGVVTDGTAVLGLGRAGPYAAVPVMEGKAAMFKLLAGIDAIPLCISVQKSLELVDILAALEPTFGGYNIEDVAAPSCFDLCAN